MLLLKERKLYIHMCKKQNTFISYLAGHAVSRGCLKRQLLILNINISYLVMRMT